MAGMNTTQFHGLVNGRRKRRKPEAAIGLHCQIGALLAFLSVRAEALPACLPPAEIPKARVLGVDAGGTLLLERNRAARFEGLLWPSTGREPVPSALRQQAMAALRQLVGKQATLRAAAPKLDRYGRLRVQVILSDGKWLQREILRRGLARVQVAPDRPDCARELYAAEALARNAHAGLWALPQYAIRNPDALRWQDLGSFQIVQGQVLTVKVNGSRAYLNFGRDWRTDFTVTISPEDMRTFRHAGVDPYGYAGKTVRVRGYVDRLHGFEIEAASPEAIEVLR